MVVGKKGQGITRREWERRRKAIEEEEKVKEVLHQKAVNEAKHRWVEEFLEPLEEFTMERYHEFLGDDDLLEEAAFKRKERDQHTSELFDSHLAEKEEEIHEAKRKTISLTTLAKGVKESIKEVHRDVTKVAIKVADILTPYEKKVENRVAANLSQVAVTDLETEQWLKHRQEVIDALDEAKKIEKVEARKRKVVLEVKQVQTQVLKKEEDRIATEARRKRIEQSKAQRQAEAEARHVAHRMEEETEKAEMAAEVDRVRKWRMKYWSKQTKALRSEAKHLQETHGRASLHHDLILVQGDEREDAERLEDRLEDQVVAPKTSRDSYLPTSENRLGVYGIPMGEGDFHGYGGGHLPSVDDAEVRLFGSTQHYVHEKAQRWPLWESQAEVGRKDLLYTQLQEESQLTGRQLDTLKETRHRLHDELQQLQLESLDLEQRLEKPLQRYADPTEKKEEHFRKDRIADLVKRMEGLKREEDGLKGKKKALENQALSLAQDLASLKEKNREAAAKMDEDDYSQEKAGGNGERVQRMPKLSERADGSGERVQRMPELPVVIGRNLGKVPEIGPFIGRPQESYQKITHASRLAVYKQQAKAAMKVRRETSQQEMAIWRASEERRMGREVLDSLLSRLKDAQDKVKGQKVENIKQNLVTALKLFFLSGEKLNPVHRDSQGMIFWWKARSEMECQGVEQFWSSEEAREEEESNTGRRGSITTWRRGMLPAIEGQDESSTSSSRSSSSSSSSRRGTLTAMEGQAEQRQQQQQQQQQRDEEKWQYPFKPELAMTSQMALADEDDDEEADKRRRRRIREGEEEQKKEEEEEEDQLAVLINPAEDDDEEGEEEEKESGQISGTRRRRRRRGRRERRSSESATAAYIPVTQIRDDDPLRQAITLGPCKHGLCMGLFEFPRADLWTIFFLVMKQEPKLADQGNPMDRVSIRLGPSFKEMVAVGTYRNVVNEDTLSIQYEVTHQVKSKTLAYRFEFLSSSEEPQVHLVITPGTYTNKPPPELQLSGSAGSIISSFVRYLRVEMAKGSMRAERLLEELVSAEASNQEEWDTDVLLNGYHQRYRTEEFIQRALVELGKLHDAEVQLNDVPSMGTMEREVMRLDNEARKEFRCLRSHNAYIKRKRAQYEEKIDTALGLRHKYINVYDEEKEGWDLYYVNDVRVRWRDLVDADIKYSLTQYNEWLEAIIPLDKQTTSIITSTIPLENNERQQPTSITATTTSTAANALGNAVVDPSSHSSTIPQDPSSLASKANDGSISQRRRLSTKSSRRGSTTSLQGKEGEEGQSIALLKSLEGKRWHEVEVPQRDENAYNVLYAQREQLHVFCAQREQLRAVEAEQMKTESQRLAAQKLALKMENSEKDEKERLRRRRLQQKRVEAEQEAEEKLADAAFREALWVQVVTVMEEMKLGLFKDSQGKKYEVPNEHHAKDEAYRRWKKDYVRSELEGYEILWEYEAEQEQKKLEKKLKKMEKKRLKREAKEKLKAEQLAQEQERLTNQRLRELAEQRMAVLKPRLRIQNFEKAVTGGPHWPQCEHLKAKAWGNAYGKGLRCVRCGKELTNTHDDQTQLDGIGYGEDVKLVQNVARHRLNSPAYRFSTAAELHQVEEERRRLEKERRLLKEQERVFYDFEDLKAIYQLDRRHQAYFKRIGIFRQGVQWTEREIEKWLRQQETYFQTLSPRSSSQKRAEMKDLIHYAQSDPPTPRKYDMVRRALFNEMLQAFSRMQNCGQRLMELKAVRAAILVRRKEASAQADFLHHHLIRLENQLLLYESALDETGGLIEMRNRADREWRNALELVKAAERDQALAEMACIGLGDLVHQGEQACSHRTSEVLTLLREKILMEREMDRISSTIRSMDEKAKKAKEEMDRESERVVMMMYRKRGQVIPTPYGRGIIQHYREKDDIVLVHLPSFSGKRGRGPITSATTITSNRGNRSSSTTTATTAGSNRSSTTGSASVICLPTTTMTKLYMCPWKALILDRAKQQAETMQMQYEDKLTQEWTKVVKQQSLRERKEMAEEDGLMQELEKEKRDLHAFRRGVDGAVLEEAKEAKTWLVTSFGQDMVLHKAEAVVREAINKREGERNQWEAQKLVAKAAGQKMTTEKPLPLQPKDRQAIRTQASTRLKEEYVEDRIHRREQQATIAMQEAIQEKQEMEALQYIIDDHLLHDLILSTAQEEVARGLEARLRTQRESGIVFLDPPHMQYCIYASLKEHWINRRESLRSQIEWMNIKCLRSRDEQVADVQRAQRMNESLEAKASRDAEEKRQALMCQAMTTEEQRCRAFYRHELQSTLRERRMMTQEDRYMKMYLLMAKRAEDVKRSAIKGGGGGGRPIFLDSTTSAIVIGALPAIGGGGGGGSGAALSSPSRVDPAEANLSRNELRRLELKKNAAEKVREEKEGLMMMLEDEASAQMRTQEKLREQRWMLLAEGRLMEAGGLEEEEGEGKGSSAEEESEDDSSVELDPVKDQAILKELPPRIEELSTIEQYHLLSEEDRSKEEVEEMIRERQRLIRRRRRRVRIIVEGHRRRQASKKALLAIWTSTYESTLLRSMKAEFAWMEAEEENRQIQLDLRTYEYNLKRLGLLLQRKAIEELRAKQEVKNKMDYQAKCLKSCEHATYWASKCRDFEGKRRMIRLRVIQDTRFKDTNVITSFYQRWVTDDLYTRLYWDYFRTLSLILCYRCEVVAVERRLMNFMDYLQHNAEESIAKEILRKQLQSGMRRKMMMQWRRSELGTRLFSRTRQHVLTVYFQGWVRFMLWRQGYQKTFELKYAIIKQEMDLRRLYPETRAAQERLIHITTTEGDGEEDGDNNKSSGVKRTLLARHKLRPLQCRNCETFYLEDQNHDLSCPFHPGEYKIACPRSCPGLSMKCMSHRMKRWNCCDNREEGEYMRNGCQARRHMAITNTEPYQAKEDAFKDAYAKRDAMLTEKLDAARTADWPRQFMNTSKQQIKALEDDLAKQRKLVAAFDHIKFH